MVTEHANFTSAVSSSFGVMYREEALAISSATVSIVLTKLVFGRQKHIAMNIILFQ